MEAQHHVQHRTLLFVLACRSEFLTPCNAALRHAQHTSSRMFFTPSRGTPDSLSDHHLLPRCLPLQFSQAAIDDNTKMLLLAAIAVLASAGVLAGTRALIESLNDRLRTASGQAQRIVITGLFGIITFFAARAVLEL